MPDPLDITLPASDPLTAAAQATAAATSAAAAAATGAAVTFLGQTLQVITAALTGNTPPAAFIPSGPGGNAADTDPRSFAFARADLAALGLRDPRDGDTVTWPGAGEYLITRAFYVPSSGKVTCLCYRPDAPAGTQDAAQLAAALAYHP